MPLSRLAAVAVALLVAASGAHAQEADATPADVVDAYNNAVTEGDWEAAASLIASEDLDKLVGLAQLIYDLDPFASAMMGLDPSDTPADLLSAFVGIAMSETPGLDDMLATAEVTLLGEVREGDDLVHIVSRSVSDFHGKTLDMVEVATLQRIDGRWRYRLSSEIDAIRAGMELAIEQPELFAPEGAPPPPVEIIEVPARDPKKQ